MSKNRSIQTLQQELKKRILVLDGAMGTAIQDLQLTAADFGGPDLEGCNENLVLTRPDLIRNIHSSYLKAGCDIVETNTFGATPLVLAEFGMGEKAYEVNLTAAKLAREACKAFTTPQKPRFVAGAIGPTTKAITVTGGISFKELEENFYVQAKGLFDGGVDYFLIETSQDTRNIKAALNAIDRLFLEKIESLPIAVSGTIEAMGTMLAGQSVEALYASLSHRDLLYLGLNCATGPEFMTDHIRSLSSLSRFPIACVPNAGLPDENGCYLESPQMISAIVGRFIEQGWINLVGGCCGTTPAHIAALVDLAQGVAPRELEVPSRSFLSGVDYLEITDELRPVIVGERTNVIGSKKFKTLITEEKFSDAAEIAKTQIKNGAQIVDVCLANPDRDEFSDMRLFLEKTIQKIRVPLMIDSTDDKVIEMALSYSQGKAIINSVNLEDGEERFEKVVPIAKKYGAALVVGTIDDDPTQGMGISRKRKLEIAARSFELLTKKYGVAAEDIYWDPLVFPCGTGDAQYVGSAEETIEAIRLLKRQFPKSKTVLGISNVSFGLPGAGRETLNAVFLYHCVQAGLDLAIVNSEKLERYASLPEREREISEDLLFNRVSEKNSDPIATFSAHFRERKIKETMDRKLIPLMDRLPGYILEGTKEGLLEDLDEALLTLKPMDIINGPLMKGMDEVGRLFNENKMIVAEVLQSAESMKTAVSYLEPKIDKDDSITRGRVLLATVKGDVHDIGKNLVEIIFANNGFEVVNLGIKVPPEQLIQAIRTHRPDIVGLSGLLVKSAHQMVATAEDFSKAGIEVPMLVGGAALSETFVDKRIAKAYTGTVAYANDAMKGLDLAKTIVDPGAFKNLKASLKKRRDSIDQMEPQEKIARPEPTQKRSSSVSLLERIPSPTDFDRHLLRNTPIEQIWNFVNPLMLYGRHLGIKGKTVKLLDLSRKDAWSRSQLEKSEPRAFQVWSAVEEIKEEFKNTDVLSPSAVYQFFKANGNGNDVLIKNGAGQPLMTFQFPRQRKEDGLCLSDYLAPEGTQVDNLAFFAVTVGRGVRELAEQLKNRGEYLKSHALQALALESAEAYAEFLHSQLRKIWGFPDPSNITMMQRFQAKYQGKRYSFGYPACPLLDDQSKLFELLRPNDIGIQLTDGFMMDPEASVSAVVFHHPDATYYSVGSASEVGDANRS